MNRETLLAELDRLLYLGEPLLTMFPKQRPDGWVLQLPDNISPEMRGYADSVAWRAWNREDFLNWWRRYQTDYVAEEANGCEVGLLGWRAIGVLE